MQAVLTVPPEATIPSRSDEVMSTLTLAEKLEDTNGNGTWDLNQARTANTVNEITGITESAGPSWATPAYSAAGNMTTVPQPADPTKTYTATYDAWNRLVKLVDDDTSDTVAEYQYLCS